ncbi:MAG TPA: MBG domain-containing protein [Chitinophagaceae bacterium]|nr:MBG domain-containing protein [Chitinophagaceae bacterium]
MKRILFTMLMIMAIGFSYSQTTYYWVGENNDSLNVTSNWNTVLNGSGTSRSSNTNANDILIFDGTNVAGGPFTVGSTGGISCAQLKYINGANVNIIRTTTMTTAIAIAGDVGDDFFVDATSKAGFTSTVGSVRIDMAVTCTGKVNGEMSAITTQQFRITNTTTGPAGSMIFTNGSKFYTNITGSSSYAFGSSAQASQKWVVFEAGSHLYYLGGGSPHGSGSLFSAIDMKPGTTWHHRGVQGGGNFFNRQSFGDVIVENNSTLTASGAIYRIENLTVETGSTFIPAVSGQTAILGNVIVNGSVNLPAGGTNKLVLAGSSPQAISGSGTITLGGLTIADNANVTLNTNITVDATVDVYGKIDFSTKQITGNATFNVAGVEPNIPGTGNVVSGRYFITGNAGVYTSAVIGKTISGTGIPANTEIVSFDATLDTIYLSQLLIGSGSGISLNVSNSGATLATSNANGFSPSTGSTATGGNKTYGDSINYIINAATTSPFGITTGSSGNMILVGFAEINAPITVNTGFKVHDYLTLNAKMILRPLDVLHIASGSVINGTFNSSNYIVTNYNGAGDQSLLRYDGLSAATTLPIGTLNYYLPATITPTVNSDFSVAVFEGITTNGAVTGPALTTTQKQTVVNAVWNINRLNGSGDAIVQLNWNDALEGSTFTTLPNTDIGLIKNNGSSWDLPVGVGDNTTNNVTATLSIFGAFSVGAVPQVDPFVFNALPTKTYGNADFNGGATSLNTTQPIIYSSSNTAVATIVNGNIHITGAGTADITASQATDGFYAAASVTQTLTVNKTALTIIADNKLKFEGQPNPTLTATYAGFVLSETSSALLTPAVIRTTAVTASAPGTYPITVNGATSNNYDITFVNGLLTVQAKQSQTITFNALPAKNYGNADFPTGATSTNNTIPITYVSSNTAVATVNSSGIIHITGGGTTTITASQAGNAGYFPAADVARTLTVSKVNLTIRVRDTTKVQGQPNPQFTITYTGLVLGETVANLTTQAQVNTIATTNSTAGYYALTPEGAVSNNYNFIYVPGRLTIYPNSGTDQQYLHAFMPNKDILTVRVYSVTPALGDIVLWDISGRPVLKKNLYMPPGFISADLFISTLPTGIYTVTVKGDGVDLKETIAIMK